MIDHVTRGKYQSEPVSFERPGLAGAIALGALLWVPCVSVLGLAMTYWSRAVRQENASVRRLWATALLLNIAGSLWTAIYFVIHLSGWSFY